MRDERTPEEKAIWDGMRELIDSLPDGCGGTSRIPGEFIRGYGDDEGGPFDRFEASSRFKQYNVRGDGVDEVYDIQVTVTKRQSTNDDYWQSQLRDREGALVINGVHYRIGSRNGTSGPFNGFGGRRFDFEMLADGRRVVVDDLWFQGPIPPKYRDQLPDNARFADPNQEPFRS